ncbi:MAG: DUF3604 domain-containing protein [Candidatus Korobacteraceae bacterium]
MKSRVAVTVGLALVLISILVLVSCEKPKAPEQAQQAGQAAQAEQRVEKNPDRNAYFGEEHIHTSWSLDAWLMGNRITDPNDALKYAQGQTIKHPMGYDITIDTPMDFMGVTDHSEYVGVTKEANTPGSAVSKLPQAQPLILKDPNDQAEIQRAFTYLVGLNSGPPVKAFMSPEVAGSIWKKNVEIADANNHPGKFTAFCSYEWTSMPNFRNLHRNIFFRDCTHIPPMPFSALDNDHPEALWTWMDSQRNAGNTLLAISHNANLSDGWMYPVDVDSYGRPIDAAWAAARDRNERLVEIKQIKGQSETHPLLSPNDEFAGYELFQDGLLGQPATGGRINHIQGSFARQAYKDGITMQDVRGYNPYKFGMAGGSDSHNTGSPYRQNNFYGGHAQIDGTVDRRMAGVLAFGTLDVRYENPGGLTGVWAEENTRESLFDAMYRKETFGTSGVHIKVRLFGGWDFNKDILKAKDWVHQSYQKGVPMGADLQAMPSGKGVAPTFVVWAVKDPTSANLDRIQLIKGWTKNGQSFEKIYDVVWSGDRKPDKWSGRVPAIKSTVDLEKATYTNDVGSTELSTVWTDPDFDVSLHAFYYARVLEIPTPRWTLIQAVKAGVPPPDVVPLTGQERAWTSPIWYTPTADARKSASIGMTVADLKAKGATALGDAQLKALIVGKAYWVRNNVTGEQFSVSYTPDGDMNVWHIGNGATIPSYVGNPMRNGYQGNTTPYKIEGGKVITKVAQDPYSLAIYKLGDTYYGARSNEFGYANYEIIPYPPNVLNPLAALGSQLAIELGLTEEQKAQITPMLKAEMPKLEALKKNTSLKPLDKIEQLKQISSSVDAQITPLLNADQQKKFTEIRDEFRREMIEKMSGKLAQKAEAEISH